MLISNDDNMDVFGSLSRRKLKENSNNCVFVTLFSVRSVRLLSVTVTVWVVVLLSEMVTSKTSSLRFSIEKEALLTCLLHLLISQDFCDHNLGSGNLSSRYRSVFP